MGFIPIILFTLAFVFLWGIVNYHSLRKTRNEIGQLQEGTIDIYRERKNIAAELMSGSNRYEGNKDYVTTIMKIADGPPIDKENIRDVLRNEANRTQLTAELNILSEIGKTLEYPEELITSLSDLTRQLRDVQPRIMDLFHNYHNMISKPPSRFIARLFGFGF